MALKHWRPGIPRSALTHHSTSLYFHFPVTVIENPHICFVTTSLFFKTNQKHSFSGDSSSRRADDGVPSGSPADGCHRRLTLTPLWSVSPTWRLWSGAFPMWYGASQRTCPTGKEWRHDPVVIFPAVYTSNTSFYQFQTNQSIKSYRKQTTSETHNQEERAIKSRQARKRHRRGEGWRWASAKGCSILPWGPEGERIWRFPVWSQRHQGAILE